MHEIPRKSGQKILLQTSEITGQVNPLALNSQHINNKSRKIIWLPNVTRPAGMVFKVFFELQKVTKRRKKRSS